MYEGDMETLPAGLEVEPREHPARTQTGAQRAPGTQASAEPGVHSAGSRTARGGGPVGRCRGRCAMCTEERQQKGSKANVSSRGSGGNLSRAHYLARRRTIFT